MGNRDVFDGDASVFIEIPKMMTNECGSEVGDNAIWETESMDDIFEELDFFLCSGRNKRLVVLRGVFHEGRLIGRDACNQEQEGNKDTRVRQVRAIYTT